MAVAELSRATGRRKEAVARVRLVPGEGKFTINRSRSLEDYFPNLAVRMTILGPFRLVGREKAYDVFALLEGGGNTGQAGAIRHGIARPLVEFNPELRPPLKRAGMLTRDSRPKERPKYGLKKARKAPQYSKR